MRLLNRKEPKLSDLEDVIKQLPGQIDIPVTHVFGGGVYVRTIHKPAGTLSIGKRHRYETCNILLSGRRSVYLDSMDGEVIHMSAPHVFITKPGSKKLVYAHTEVVFATVHPNPMDSTDPDEIEKEVIISEEEWELLNTKEGVTCLL